MVAVYFTFPLVCGNILLALKGMLVDSKKLEISYSHSMLRLGP